MKLFSTDELAVVALIPTDFAFGISVKEDKVWTEVFNGSFKNEFRMRNGSGHVSLVDDAFNITAPSPASFPLWLRRA